MIKLQIVLVLILVLLVGCSAPGVTIQDKKVLSGKRITVDPGHGDTQAYDSYRVGPSGEREEWINLRVAKLLVKKLRRAGADVYLTRSADKDLSLGGRATLAKKHGSHLFISIHHNGSGNDPGMDLPIVYYFGDARLNPASVDFAHILLGEMHASMEFEQQDAGAVYSDHLIYSSGTSVLRNTVDVLPGVIGEAGFFTNSAGEERLKSRTYNKLEADVYFRSIVEYFSRGYPTAVPALSDTVQFIIPGQVVEFALDDGFGGSSFREESFLVLQDEDTLDFSWQPKQSVLEIQTIPTEERDIDLRIFGRNLKGNALHPRVFTISTESGFEWYSFEFWADAFDTAEEQFEHIAGSDSVTLESIDSALHLYELSLDLQIVHAKALVAERRILALLEMKQKLTEADLSDDITAQRQKLHAYYPQLNK